MAAEYNAQGGATAFHLTLLRRLLLCSGLQYLRGGFQVGNEQLPFPLPVVCALCAKNGGGMHGGKDRRIAGKVYDLSPLLRHAKARSQQGLGGGGSEADDQPGPDGFDLGIHPWVAGCYLPQVWLFVDAPLSAKLPFEVLYRIGYICRFPIDARFFHAAVEHMPGGTDERFSLQVFLIAGLLADEENGRRRLAFSEYRLRGFQK